jgi:hypothetical protein
VASVLVFLGAASCSLAISPPESQVDELLIPSAHSLLPIAYATAREWRGDAHLIFIDIQIHPKLVALFSFNSPSDPKAGLNVYVEDPLNKPQTRAVEVRSPSRMEARPSVDSYAEQLIDSDEAFQIALDGGARSYLQDHPEAWAESWLWYVNLRYVRAPEGTPVAWRVYLTDLESSGYEVLIDPQTGDVLAVSEGP